MKEKSIMQDNDTTIIIITINFRIYFRGGCDLKGQAKKRTTIKGRTRRGGNEKKDKASKGNTPLLVFLFRHSVGRFLLHAFCCCSASPNDRTSLSFPPQQHNTFNSSSIS